MNPSSEIPIRMQGTRRDQSCFGFLSIRNQALWDYADVGCKSARYERHESCSQQKFFEVFDGQQISQTTFVLDFGSKGASIAAPKSLLCAVASEGRRAKWKLKSASVGCGSAWKRLTSRTRTVCSN